MKNSGPHWKSAAENRVSHLANRPWYQKGLSNAPRAFTNEFVRDTKTAYNTVANALTPRRYPATFPVQQQNQPTPQSKLPVGDTSKVTPATSSIPSRVSADVVNKQPNMANRAALVSKSRTGLPGQIDRIKAGIKPNYQEPPMRGLPNPLRPGQPEATPQGAPDRSQELESRAKQGQTIRPAASTGAPAPAPDRTLSPVQRQSDRASSDTTDTQKAGIQKKAVGPNLAPGLGGPVAATAAAALGAATANIKGNARYNNQIAPAPGTPAPPPNGSAPDPRLPRGDTSNITPAGAPAPAAAPPKPDAQAAAPPRPAAPRPATPRPQRSKPDEGNASRMQSAMNGTFGMNEDMGLIKESFESFLRTKFYGINK